MPTLDAHGTTKTLRIRTDHTGTPTGLVVCRVRCGRELLKLALPPRHVVVDDDLHVLRCPNGRPRAVVAGHDLWVHINHLAVPLVLEQEAGLVVRDNLHTKGSE